MVLAEGTRVRRIVPSSPPEPEGAPSSEPLGYSIRNGLVATSELTIFPQIRVVFDGIEELADNIAEVRNLIQPVSVGLLTEKEALAYVDGFNFIWEKDVVVPEDINWVQQGNKRWAKVLIDGERRTRAFKVLETVGCMACQQDHGQGSCLGRHIPGEKMRTTYFVGISYKDALLIQYSANLSRPNYPHEQAEAFRRAFRAEQLKNPQFSLSDLARKYAMARSTVIEMMNFCQLPESIRDLVSKKYIEYGHAVLLSQLQREVNLTPEDLMYWAVHRVVAPNRKVSQFKKDVEGYLQDLGKRPGMLDIFTEVQEEAMRKSRFKRVALPELVLRLREYRIYARRIRRMIDDGLIGKENSPFSELSPQKSALALAREMAELTEHLSGLSTTKKTSVQTDLRKSMGELNLLLQRAGIDTKAPVPLFDAS